jgi:hypothetical protein
MPWAAAVTKREKLPAPGDTTVTKRSCRGGAGGGQRRDGPAGGGGAVTKRCFDGATAMNMGKQDMLTSLLVRHRVTLSPAGSRASLGFAHWGKRGHPWFLWADFGAGKNQPTKTMDVHFFFPCQVLPAAQRGASSPGKAWNGLALLVAA